MGFTWQWGYAEQLLPILLKATTTTIIATIIGYLIALIVGLVFLVLQRTRYPAVNRLVREIVEFIRTTPLLLQVFFIFYVGPQYGMTLSPWVAGMAALGLHYGAYLSEVYRGALYTVPAGQWEACKAMNLSAYKTYARIILPQALPPSLPSLGMYLIGCTKDTTLLTVISVPELINVATVQGTIFYRYLEPYTLAGLIFIALTLAISAGLNGAESWVTRKLGMKR